MLNEHVNIPAIQGQSPQLELWSYEKFNFLRLGLVLLILKNMYLESAPRPMANCVNIFSTTASYFLFSLSNMIMDVCELYELNFYNTIFQFKKDYAKSTEFIRMGSIMHREVWTKMYIITYSKGVGESRLMLFLLLMMNIQLQFPQKLLTTAAVFHCLWISDKCICMFVKVLFW